MEEAYKIWLQDTRVEDSPELKEAFEAGWIFMATLAKRFGLRIEANDQTETSTR